MDFLREAIRVAHYTVFVRLVRAHQGLQRLATPPQTDAELFEYLNAVEDLYVSLGNAWICYRHVFGDSCLELNGGGGDFLKHVQHSPGISKLVKRYQDGPRLLRNNIVHFGRHAMVVTAAAVLLPLPISKNPLWTKALGQAVYAKVDLLAAQHLLETEELFNALHEECMVLVRCGLQVNGAQLDYS